MEKTLLSVVTAITILFKVTAALSGNCSDCPRTSGEEGVSILTFYVTTGSLSFLVLVLSVTTLCCCCLRHREKQSHEDRIIEAKLLRNAHRNNARGGHVHHEDEGVDARVDTATRCESSSRPNNYEQASVKQNSQHFYDCLAHTNDGLHMRPPPPTPCVRRSKTKGARTPRKRRTVSGRRRSTGVTQKRRTQQESRDQKGGKGLGDSGGYYNMNSPEVQRNKPFYEHVAVEDRPALATSAKPEKKPSTPRNRKQRREPPPPPSPARALQPAPSPSSSSLSDYVNMASEKKAKKTSAKNAQKTSAKSSRGRASYLMAVYRASKTAVMLAGSTMKLAHSPVKQATTKQKQFRNAPAPSPSESECSEIDCGSSDGEYYYGSSGEDPDGMLECSCHPNRLRRPLPPPGEKWPQQETSADRPTTSYVTTGAQTDNLRDSPSPQVSSPHNPRRPVPASRDVSPSQSFRHSNDDSPPTPSKKGQMKAVRSAVTLSDNDSEHSSDSEHKQRKNVTSPGDRDYENEDSVILARQAFAVYDSPRGSPSSPSGRQHQSQPQHPRQPQQNDGDGVADSPTLHVREGWKKTGWKVF